MDHSLLHSLNNFFFHHDGVEDVWGGYEKIAEALFLGALVLAFLVALGSARTLVRRTVVSAGLSAGIALAIAHFVASAVDRARPFVADPHGVHQFTHHAADPGFPSDHATAAFAIAVAVLLRNRVWGAVVLVAAVVLAVGRVALGVHYPSDVLAGAALGAAVAIAMAHGPAARLVDALADRVGDIYDGLLRSAGVRLSARS